MMAGAGAGAGPSGEACGAIVVINAGSSSLKFALYGDDQGALSLFLTGQMEGIETARAHFIARHPDGGDVVMERSWPVDGPSYDEAMAFLVAFVRDHLDGHPLEAVGHRIVHGGAHYTQAVRLDADILNRLQALAPLAPLHQAHNLAPVRSIMTVAPDLPQVGCFDTAFHATQPALAQAFALPASITEQGVRRYGFHGLSYQYIAHRLAELDPALAAGRVIVAHLGNGASLCAMRDGRSVASTMGFTAVEGLPMGTRCGALDPGVLLYLMDELGYDARAIEHLIYKESGLLGVSGISSDMRELEQSDDPRALLAIDLFIYRIGREIGSLAAALGGLDGLVLTGGIGENSVLVRRGIADAAAWLGLELDQGANAAPGDGAARISAPASRVAVWVIPTDEQGMIARQTRDLLR